MKPERRCTRRERPNGLSYIQFEPEGGGIVVDASEQGLAFHAAAVLQQAGPIQLCVSPNPMEQIKLTAEIAWMDEKKKSGGLRFKELTGDAKNQVLQWLAQTGESEAPGGKFTVPSCALAEETGLRFGNGTPDQLPPAPDSAIPSPADSATLVDPRLWSAPGTAFLPAPFSQQGQSPIPGHDFCMAWLRGF
jgi:PilZ domain-containing protein